MTAISVTFDKSEASKALVISLRNGTRVVIGEGDVTTTLPCGTVVHAYPDGTPAQLNTARELGYGDDVVAMTRDHDPLHSVLAAWLGMPASASLRAAAGHAVDDLAELEERAVVALQALTRRLGVSPAELASRIA